jgi:putative peptidoglycan binding protein
MVDNANSAIPGEDGPTAEASAPQREGPRPKFEIAQSRVWITAPLLIAFLGLLGTGLGALIQQYSNTLLERNKFEYTLIQKALDVPNRQDAAKALLFYQKIGLLRGLTEGKIDEASTGEAKDLPVFHGAALRDKVISVWQAKTVLKYLTAQNNLKDGKNPNFYDGPIDDRFDLNFNIAIMKFQKEMKLDIDGLIGPKTVLALWEACPACPNLLQENEPTDNPSK